MQLSNFHVYLFLLCFTQTQSAVAQNTDNDLGCNFSYDGYNFTFGTDCNSSIAGYDSAVLPWSWVVTPDTPALQATCPSVFHTISMFATVNIIAAFLMAILGNSAIRRRITFCKRKREREMPKESVIKGALLAIVFTQLANLGVACLIKYTPGYGSGFAIWELWLFYSTRPRFGWVASVVLSPFGGKRKSEGQIDNNARLSYATRSNAQILGILPPEKEYFWLTATHSAIYAECFLQLFALYNMISTISSGIENKMYNHISIPRSERVSVYVMTIGAFLFCIARLPLNVLLVRLDKGFRFRFEAAGISKKKNAYLLIFVVPVLWLPQWAFFGGYIALAGHAYCPPKLVTQGSIWVGAAFLSALLGGSM